MGRRRRRIFLFACICICVTTSSCSRWWLQCDGGGGTTAIGNLILHCFQMCKEGLDQTCGKPFLLLTTCNQKLTSGKKKSPPNTIYMTIQIPMDSLTPKRQGTTTTIQKKRSTIPRNKIKPFKESTSSLLVFPLGDVCTE